MNTLTYDSQSITKWICLCGKQIDDLVEFKNHVDKECPFRLTDDELASLDLKD